VPLLSFISIFNASQSPEGSDNVTPPLAPYFPLDKELKSSLKSVCACSTKAQSSRVIVEMIFFMFVGFG
jgi:hypothetical protein